MHCFDVVLGQNVLEYEPSQVVLAEVHKVVLLRAQIDGVHNLLQAFSSSSQTHQGHGGKNGGGRDNNAPWICCQLMKHFHAETVEPFSYTIFLPLVFNNQGLFEALWRVCLCG